MKNNLIIDCFAGGGGASVGIEMALGRQVNIAINHDPEAIRMHKANHPDTIHLTEDIFKVDLQKYVKGRKVALMWASPDCTSHSKAKGGQPRKKGLRILPWAADYGAPTTRKRWYAIFRRDGKDIIWPEQTHFKNSEPKWKQCGELIDWSDLGKSIFDRKKPLAEATQKRIANGIRKYIIENPEPYIVKNKEALTFLIQYHGEQKEGESRGQLLSEPIKTIDTSNRYGLVTAFITKYYKTGIGQGCDEPLHTITTSPGHFGLVSAFLIKYYGSGCGQELKEPLATITTKDRFGLVNVIIDIAGEKYVIKDIFLRMLKPEELKRMQGFPDDYIIDKDIEGKRYPIKEQVARIGNSVVPVMAKALVEENCPYLKVGERVPNMKINKNSYQLKFA